MLKLRLTDFVKWPSFLYYTIWNGIRSFPKGPNKGLQFTKLKKIEFFNEYF